MNGLWVQFDFLSQKQCVKNRVCLSGTRRPFRLTFDLSIRNNKTTTQNNIAMQMNVNAKPAQAVIIIEIGGV
jgi:hypothetical protein